MSGAYYNENDPKAAAWLRELIRRNLIAPGEVDERSIVDIAPKELVDFTQCHFFAGIGVWSYALRTARWSDNRRVWTGSCPCQPFSQAGKGSGADDERHLWPYWEHLIRELRPPIIFGEQVASPAAGAWADLVQDDLEALGYAFGAVPFPAASVGAPHIRDRLYWVADLARDGRREERPINRGVDAGDRAEGLPAGLEPGGSDSAMADADGRNSGAEGVQRGREYRQLPEDGLARERIELGDASGSGSGRDAGAVPSAQGGTEREVRSEPDFPESSSLLGQSPGSGRERSGGESAHGILGQASPWAGCEFVWCRDGKWRPVEPGTFPLVNGAPARVGRLRGYGNAIVSEAAKVFIEASGLV